MYTCLYIYLLILYFLHESCLISEKIHIYPFGTQKESLIYLNRRERQIQTERERRLEIETETWSSLLWLTLLIAAISWIRARPKPGVRNSLQVSQMGGSDWMLGPSFASELHQQGAGIEGPGGKSRHSNTGCRHPRQRYNPLYHNLCLCSHGFNKAPYTFKFW